MHALILVVLYFFIYSFVGWVNEFIYVLVVRRQVRAVSFLRLPISPIYGIGALVIMYVVAPYITNPILLFVTSVLATTVIEYVSHIIIERLFHIQLWNYDNRRFNFQGRVVLGNSIGFGLLALLLVYGLHPLIESLVGLIPDTTARIATVVLIGALLIDATLAISSLAQLRFNRLGATTTDVQAALLERLAQLAPSSDTKLRLRRTRRALLRLHRANVRRIEKAFPGVRFTAARR